MFCEMCGKSIAEDARFCSNCGHQTKADGQAGDMKKPLPTYRVTVLRANQWFAINPAVHIVVNRRDHYEIENDGVLAIDLPEGEHHFEFSLHMRNKAFVLNLMDNVILNVKWNRLTGALEVN